MLAGMERHGHAALRADLAGPHARTVGDIVGADDAPLAIHLPLDAGDAAALLQDADDLGARDDAGAALPGALGERERDIGRVRLPVCRQMHGGDDILDVEMGIHLLDLGRSDLVDLDAEGPGERGLAAQLLGALAGERDGEGADHLHAGRDTRLGLQRGVEIGRVFREPGHVLRGAELADQPGRMPGGAAGELLALQEDHIGPAQLGEVVGERASRDATADDDGAGMGRKVSHLVSPAASVGAPPGLFGGREPPGVLGRDPPLRDDGSEGMARTDHRAGSRTVERSLFARSAAAPIISAPEIRCSQIPPSCLIRPSVRTAAAPQATRVSPSITR